MLLKVFLVVSDTVEAVGLLDADFPVELPILLLLALLPTTLEPMSDCTSRRLLGGAGDDELEEDKDERSGKGRSIESICRSFPLSKEVLLILPFLDDPVNLSSLVNGTGESSTDRGVTIRLDLLNMMKKKERKKDQTQIRSFSTSWHLPQKEADREDDFEQRMLERR